MSLHEYDDLDSIGRLEDRRLDRSPGVFNDERERSNGFIDAEFARQGVGQ